MAAFDEKDYTKSFDWSIWKRLTPFVRPFRRDFVGMLVFNGLCALVDVAIPLFQRYAIRNFIQADSLRGIVPFSLAYLLVIVLQALSVVAFARNSMTIEMNMGRDMRRSLFHHLQTLSFSFYNVTPVGYLLTRVMSDTNRIASMIAWNMTDILWALFYVLGTFAAMLALNWRLALVVIVMNVGLIPQVFGRIFSEAFDFQAIFAGFTGSAVMQGVKRGLFSNEAGVGSAPNAAASANVSHPVKQGLVQMLSVFLDTLVICSATAFMLLCSGVEPAVELQGAPYVQSALAASFGTLGPVFITVAMVLFAFTTLIGNLYYVDNALAYLLGHVPSKRFMVVFRLIAMGLIFLGAGLTLDLVWNLSDVLMGVMVLINIPVIAVLSRPAAAALRNYTEQRRAGKNPVFRAADIGLKEKTEYWN